MAMLATLEGTETTGNDEYILSRMFSPNDGLGVELLGVDGWNYAKRKVANAAITALKNKRLFIVPEIIYCDQMDKHIDLGMVQLFGMDYDYCTELLGRNVFKSITKKAKKVVDEVSKAVTKAPQKIAENINPVNATTNFLKTQKDLIKKYTKPSQALKLTLFPTEQLKVVSANDISGISKAVIKQAAKISPDLKPYEDTKKIIKKIASTSQPTRQIFKIGEKSVKVADIPSPGGIYEQTQKPEPEIRYITQYVNTPSGAVEALPAETTTETAGFDWSGLLNWKTLAVGGVFVYLIFGRGNRGKRK